MRRIGFRRGYGFGHLFGLLFLFRHPILILVIVAVVFAIYLYRRRRSVGRPPVTVGTPTVASRGGG